MKKILSIIKTLLVIIILYITLFMSLFTFTYALLNYFNDDGNIYENMSWIVFCLIIFFVYLFPAFIIFLGFKYKTNLANIEEKIKTKINDIPNKFRSLEEENKIKILGSVLLFFPSLGSGFTITLISTFLFIFLFTLLSKTKIVGILDRFLYSETDHIIVLGGLILFFIAVFIFKLPAVECLACYFCYMVSFLLSFGLKKGSLIVLGVIITNLLCIFVLKTNFITVFFLIIFCMIWLIGYNYFEIKPLSDVEKERFERVQKSLANTYLTLFFSVAAKSSLISLIRKLVNKYRGRGGGFGGGGAGGGF